jgi:hypothetical protein
MPLVLGVWFNSMPGGVLVYYHRRLVTFLKAARSLFEGSYKYSVLVSGVREDVTSRNG